MSRGTMVMTNVLLMNLLVLRNLLPWSFKNIKQKIANLNMKDQCPRGNTLNEPQEKWKKAHNN